MRKIVKFYFDTKLGFSGSYAGNKLDLEDPDFKIFVVYSHYGTTLQNFNIS